MKFDDPNFVKQIISTDFSNHKSLLEDVFEEIDTRTRQERNILLQPFYADQMFYYHPEDPHFKGYLLLPHGGSFDVAFEYYSVEDFAEKFNQAMPASYDDFKEQLREQIGKHDYEDLINRDSHAISNLYKSMVIAKTTMKEFSNTYLQVTETIDKLAGVVNDYLEENGRDDLLFNENDYFNLYQRSKAVNEYLANDPLYDLRVVEKYILSNEDRLHDQFAKNQAHILATCNDRSLIEYACNEAGNNCVTSNLPPLWKALPISNSEGDKSYNGEILFQDGGSLNIEFKHDGTFKDFVNKFNQATPSEYEDFKTQFADQLPSYVDEQEKRNVFLSLKMCKEVINDLNQTRNELLELDNEEKQVKVQEQKSTVKQDRRR